MPKLGLVVGVLVLWQLPARADDADCPLGRADAAAGTGATVLAEEMEACLADPTCSKTGVFPSVTTPRAPHGRFLSLDGSLGALARARGRDEVDVAGLVDARIHAGWYRGLQVCARTRAELGVESRADSAFGLSFPMAFWTVAIGGEESYLARPALSAPRIWLRRAYTSKRMYISSGMVVWRGSDGSTSSVFPVDVATEFRDQADGPRDPAIVDHLHTAIYEREHGDARVEVLALQVDNFFPQGLPRDPNAPPPPPLMMLTHFEPLVLRGALFGGLHGEARAGWVESTLPNRCPACSGLVGAVELGGTVHRDTWSLRAERSSQLALDARVTLEDRFSATFRRPGRHHTLRLDAFTALTRTSVNDAASVVTGGVDAGLDLALRHHLQLSLDASAGRSYYARLDAGPNPVAEPAALAEVRLERRFSLH